jgi:hypothetical protein
VSARGEEARGLLLYLEPVGWSVAIVAVALPRLWEAAAGHPADHPGVLALRLLVLATALTIVGRRLPRRTDRLVRIWQNAVERRGGDARPAQPVYLLSLTEQSDDPTREPLRSLQSSLYALMRDPGRSARRSLAAVGAVMALEVEWELWLRSSAADRWPSTAAGLLGLAGFAICTGLCALALLDLAFARVRRWRRPWQACPASYPSGWRFQSRATRLPSLPIVVLLVVLAVGWEIAVHEPTFDKALDRVGILLTFLAGMWAARARWTIVRPIETSRAHQLLWRALGLGVRASWYLARGLMIALAAAVVLLLSFGMAAGDDGGPALEVAIPLLALLLACRGLVADWRRPERFLQASSEEIVARTTGTALDRRVSAGLGFMLAVWALLRFL